MGKCLTIVKLVGIGSLGVSSGIYLLSSWKYIPKTINNSKTVEQLKQKISKFITNLRLSFWSLGSLSTYLLYQAYTRSPSYGKHPYLIYAALTFPIASIFNYYYSFNNEQKLITDAEEKIIYRTEKKIIKDVQNPEEETSPLDNSVYNDLGHQSPKITEREVDVEVPHLSKVELAEETYKSILSNLNTHYLYSGIILGTGFILGVIGYVGDNLK
jgi:hypothetical protein